MRECCCWAGVRPAKQRYVTLRYARLGYTLQTAAETGARAGSEARAVSGARVKARARAIARARANVVLLI